MDRDEMARQGKQMASDLRDTVSQKVSENQDTLKGTLGKAARWVDEKTGGKYSEQIGKAESKVGEGIGWVAAQGSSTPQSGAPGAPGAAAADPAPGGSRPTPPGPVTRETPSDDAGTPPTAPGPQAPQTPTADDSDAPRPPQG